MLLPYSTKFSKLNQSKFYFSIKERDEIQKYYINLLHEANKNFASKEPEKFFEVYNEYLGKGDYFYNELILDALFYCPEYFDEECIKYLLTDFDRTLFEKSEGYERKLVLSKRLIGKISKTCSITSFQMLENKIIHYISPTASKSLKNRIQTNQTQDDRVYWPFWGELQYRLLSVLPKERMSREALGLLKVLERKNYLSNSFYESKSGSVVSSLSGKDISLKSWEKILISEKIERKTRWDDDAKIFIESSPQEFSMDFRNAVSKNPSIYITLFLKLSAKNEINPHYVTGLLGGIEDFEELPDHYLNNIESILLNHVNEENWNQVYSFFKIIEKNPHLSWSQKTLDKLIYFLKNSSLDVLDIHNETQNSEEFARQSYSTLRGHAIHTLDKLISNNPTYISYFRETILAIVNENSDFVKFNSIFLINSLLESEREFAKELFELVFEKNEKMLAHWYSNYIVYSLYDECTEMIHTLLQLGLNSKDTLIEKKSSSIITEIYLNKGQMKSVVFNDYGYHAESICQMAINYLKINKYNKEAKEIILYYLKRNVKLTKILPQLFSNELLNINEDQIIIKNLLIYKYEDKLYYYFLRFLENQAFISDFQELIFESISYFLNSNNSTECEVNYYKRNVQERLSRLILNLYDEQKGDDISEKCLDFIDIMFENEFGSSRLLINELMQI